MEKKLYSFQNENKKRAMLYEVLPLKFPFALDFFVSNACNFRCFYCLQAEKQHQAAYFKKGSMMTFDTFKACVDNICKEGKLKILTMSGTGEPLMNPDIVKMVKYAVTSGVADSIEIVSNGSLLTHTLSKQLAEAGLSKLRISLQGLSNKEYKERSNVDLDYEELKEQIHYFYQVRKQTTLYVKVMDFMVNEAERKEKFFADYESYCDQISIESLVPLYDTIDYSVSGSSFNSSLYGTQTQNCKVCTRPFFHCAVEYDGSMIPCCILPPSIVYGNAAEDFAQGWNGKKRASFLLDLLKGQKKKYQTCASCTDSVYRTRETDILDEHIDELIERFELI